MWSVVFGEWCSLVGSGYGLPLVVAGVLRRLCRRDAPACGFWKALETNITSMSLGCVAGRLLNKTWSISWPSLSCKSLLFLSLCFFFVWVRICQHAIRCEGCSRILRSSVLECSSHDGMGYCTLVSYGSTTTHDRGHCNSMSTYRSHRHACRQTCPSEFTCFALHVWTADCCRIKCHFIFALRYETTGCFNDGLVF